jgi:hypothetical protein
VPNRPPSEPPFQPSEEPLHAASSLPIGLPTPERPLSLSDSLPPPRILRNARPNPSPPQPFLLFFTRRPSGASSNRRQSCSSSGPTTTRKESPSSFTQTRAFVPFRFLCPSTPTPSPLFRLHLRLPQRIPPIRKGLQDLVPDPLFLEFLKPSPGGLIGAIWAGPIAPPAAGNPRTQDPVEDLAVLHPRSSGFGPGRQQSILQPDARF